MITQSRYCFLSAVQEGSSRVFTRDSRLWSPDTRNKPNLEGKEDNLGQLEEESKQLSWSVKSQDREMTLSPSRHCTEHRWFTAIFSAANGILRRQNVHNIVAWHGIIGIRGKSWERHLSVSAHSDITCAFKSKLPEIVYTTIQQPCGLQVRIICVY